MVKDTLHAKYKANKNTDLTYGEFCFWEGKLEGRFEGIEQGRKECKSEIFAILQQLVDEHSIDRTTLIQRVNKMLGE